MTFEKEMRVFTKSLYLSKIETNTKIIRFRDVNLRYTNEYMLVSIKHNCRPSRIALQSDKLVAIFLSRKAPEYARLSIYQTGIFVPLPVPSANIGF